MSGVGSMGCWRLKAISTVITAPTNIDTTATIQEERSTMSHTSAMVRDRKILARPGERKTLPRNWM